MSILTQVNFMCLHSYLQIEALCTGKDVLVIEPDEGDGALLLTRSARNVVGLSISADSPKSYLYAGNLTFTSVRDGCFPDDDGTFDVVTLLGKPGRSSLSASVLEEARRVLRPSGILVSRDLEVVLPPGFVHVDVRDYRMPEDSGVVAVGQDWDHLVSDNGNPHWNRINTRIAVAYRLTLASACPLPMTLGDAAVADLGQVRNAMEFIAVRRALAARHVRLDDTAKKQAEEAARSDHLRRQNAQLEKEIGNLRHSDSQQAKAALRAEAVRADLVDRLTHAQRVIHRIREAADLQAAQHAAASLADAAARVELDERVSALTGRLAIAEAAGADSAAQLAHLQGVREASQAAAAEEIARTRTAIRHAESELARQKAMRLSTEIKLEAVQHDANAESRHHVLRSALIDRFLGWDRAAIQPTGFFTGRAIAKARRFARKRDWPAAERVYRTILTTNPRLPRIWIQYGHMLKEQADLRAALGAYQRAAILEPGDYDALLQLGHMQKALGQRDQAIASWKAALCRHPGQVGLWEDLRHAGQDPAAFLWDMLDAGQLGLRAPAAPSRFGRNGARSKARAAARRHDWRAAAGHYRTALARNPHDPRLWIQYGHALKEAGEAGPAQAAYFEALALDPANQEPRRFLPGKPMPAVLPEPEAGRDLPASLSGTPSRSGEFQIVPTGDLQVVSEGSFLSTDADPRFDLLPVDGIYPHGPVVISLELPRSDRVLRPLLYVWSGETFDILEFPYLTGNQAVTVAVRLPDYVTFIRFDPTNESGASFDISRMTFQEHASWAEAKACERSEPIAPSPGTRSAVPAVVTPGTMTGTDGKDAARAVMTAGLAAFLASGATLRLPSSLRPQVSIILILYNQAELTFACLNSIAQWVGTTEVRSEVIILDNGSSDATGELLSRLEGGIVLRSPENLHFLRGVNKAAQSATGHYLLLLNNDAQLLPGTLDAALRTIETEPDVGAVGGRLILPDGTLQEAGSIIWSDGSCTGYARGRSPSDPEAMFARDVDFCSGAFLLTPRSLFWTLGGLDERYAPAYYEEVDYCVRLWQAGLRVVYDPEATVLHHEFGSAGTSALELQARNHAMFRDRHAAWLATRTACTPVAALAARSVPSNRKRILVLEDRVPHDRFGSGYPRSRRLLEDLSADADVTLFPMFPVAETWPDIRQTLPANVEVMLGYSRETLGTFLAARRGFYDAVVVCRPHNMETFSMAIDTDPSVLDGAMVIYDAEALFSARDIRKQAILGSPLSAAEGKRLIETEVALVGRADALVSVSDAEIREFRRHTTLPIHRLSHAIEVEPSSSAFEDRQDILFVGVLHEDDSPNVDSLRWFAAEVLPLLRRMLGAQLRVKVAGSVRARSILDLDGLDFDLLGPVERLDRCFAEARLMIAPTRYSAGIPLKIGQAAAFGVPVVATGLLAEQLGWESGKEVLTADTAADFAQKCYDLYTDPALWARLRGAALQRCASDFSPQAFRQTVKELLTLIPSRRPAVPPLITPPRDYPSWVRTYDTLSRADRKAIAGRIAAMKAPPTISVIVPLYNTPEPWLRRCIESVVDQLYPYWELCLADDASTDPRVAEVCRAYAATDNRIRFQRRAANGHISAASNTALEMATGGFVALLDHDDELADHALYMVAEALERQPTLDVVYSDEDKIDVHGNRSEPWCKPDWSYDLMLSQNAMVHLCVYRRTTLLEIGGFRLGLEGSQDYDVALRMTEKAGPSRICHIPHVLYHWRAIPGSVALSTDQKDYPYRAGERAIQEHLDRRDSGAKVIRERHDGYYRVQWPLPDPAPAIAIIIPTKDKVELLRTAVTSIVEKTDYPNYRIIIVNNRSKESQTIKYLKSLARHKNVSVLSYDKPYSYAALNNWAVRQVDTPLLAFLNNDIEVMSGDWLSEMVRHAVRPEVGAVGAKLYYPDMTIQHAGVVVGIAGQAGHPHVGLERGHPGYFGRAGVIQNFSAVTAACLLMRREVFAELGGFDEARFAIAFNDVDLGLRVNKAGYSVVWTPYAELMHHESASLGPSNSAERHAQFLEERRNLRERWPSEILNDPFYNPNLTITGGDWSVSFPPRAKKPWRREEPMPHP